MKRTLGGQNPWRRERENNKRATQRRSKYVNIPITQKEPKEERKKMGGH